MLIRTCLQYHFNSSAIWQLSLTDSLAEWVTFDLGQKQRQKQNRVILKTCDFNLTIEKLRSWHHCDLTCPDNQEWHWTVFHKNNHHHCCQSVTFRFRNFSVSKLFHFFDGIGIGFGNFWYRKKYRYRFRKNLVSEKSIGIGFEIFWYRKKYRYRFRNFLVSKKVSVSVSKKNWY